MDNRTGRCIGSLVAVLIASTVVVGCANQTTTSTDPDASDAAANATVALEDQIQDAILAGDDALVEVLLEAGLDPNADLGGGATPLHRAAAADRATIVAILIDSGVDVDARADNGQTPLMIAAGLAGPETIDALLDGGADPLLSNPKLEGMTALHYAAWQGRPDALAALLDSGVDIDLVDGRETTALMYTTFLGNPESADLLLARGCDLNHRDNDGMTALFWARYHEFPGIARAIEDAGGVE